MTFRSVSCVWFACVLCAVSGPAAAGADAHGGFEDVTAAIGLDRQPEAGDELPFDGFDEENGGLAVADIDGDGRLELYVSYGDEGPGRLFGWDGSRFAPLAGNRGLAPRRMDRAGYFIDLDGDGSPDFLSIQAGGAVVFRNDGAGRFREEAGAFGIRLDRETHSMAAADYDNDGDLDLFFAHWDSPWNGQRPATQYLWRNDGRGRFEDVSRIVPVRPVETGASRFSQEFSFTPTFSDIDGDGDPDLLLAGDFGASQVLRNDAGRGFTDIAGHALTDENGMGAAVADYDRDGDLDWFVTSIFDPDKSAGQGTTGNRLYRNLGGGFEDATEEAGVREGGWAWGACFADFDNDGHADIFHTNGWFVSVDPGERGYPATVVEFQTDRSRLFMSNGDGTFTERGAELGIEHRGQGRGVVCTDYDGDGRVDIFIANHGAAPTVYRNAIDNGHRWLSVSLSGRFDNREGIGARVTVHTATGRQVQEVRLGTGYLSQAPPVLHFGLGEDRVVRSVEVSWPGPGGQGSRVEDVSVDRRLTIRQPEPEGVLLSVVRGSGGGLHEAGRSVPIEAEAPRGHYRFSHWSSEGGGVFADAGSARTSFTVPRGPARALAHYLPGPAGPGVSAARRWIEVLLQAIRDDLARPTVHARNLFHLSAAMYDAWAVYSDGARPWLFGAGGVPCGVPALTRGVDAEEAREEAIGHAAWMLIRHRFRRSPGFTRTARNADSLMSALGYDAGGAGPAGSPAGIGRCIGAFYIARGLEDGSNEREDYRSAAYRPVNPALEPRHPGNHDLLDPNRWQPMGLRLFVDQAGNPADGIHEFVTPEWGRVLPFALGKDDLTVHKREGADYYVYHDPGPPPTLGGPLAGLYKWGFALVGRWSSQLAPDDGATIDISPGGIGNIPALPHAFEDHPAFYDPVPWGPGHALNPATGRPYEPQPVPRGDYTRVLAEFWADGPDSETPPGHWFAILNTVNDHEMPVRRMGGEGPVLDPLEWDVKAYFTLGGAMHDAAIAAWGIKGRYDYIRPISALRAMAGRGQSSDAGRSSWSADGIALVEGFIEPVGRDDPLAGETGQHAGKIKLRAWQGPEAIRDPARDVAGVGWILAENWWPYQRPTFVTPPFAGYVSGHSTFSRAAAEVLTALTGDAFFPGGMSEFRIRANDFLVFERGPSVDMTLQWATYRDAADQCSLSRIWGGIHPPADDIPGRLIGARIGRDAVRLARSHF